MCGIAGLIGAPDPALLRSMIARLAHRGPDDSGLAIAGPVGVACARLSLLDFDRGGQPLRSDTAPLVIAFNGEIYNHGALRRDLREQYRCVFRSRSDTEVVVRGFECEGTAFLSRLEGMFALAITDGRGLWLARDTFGMKPLFCSWSSDRRRLLFASEAKALFAAGAVARTLNREALVEYATFGFTLDGHTLFAAVEQIAPGEVLHVVQQADATLSVERSRLRIAGAAAFRGNEAEAVEALADALEQSVQEQLTADHSVGCLISGGIDSSLLAELGRAARLDCSFTAGDRLDAEGFVLAQRVADHVHTSHAEIHLEPDRYVESIPAAVAAMELPAAPTLAFLAAPVVRRTTKAVLCGDGADELFAGYSAHADPRRLLFKYRKTFGHIARSAFADQTVLDSTLAMLTALDHGSGAQRAQRIHDFLMGDQLANYHLWIWDRGSMAAGLEVRLPFLNTRVRALAAALPLEWRIRDGRTKVVLRALLERRLPGDLAAAIAGQRKRAAWDSGRRCFAALEQYAAHAVRGDAHPLRSLFAHPVELLLFDVFLAVFLVHDGVVPPGFDVDHLHTTYRDDLARIHRTLR
jgi:asparagine synthase (glutamine-hydrolysing)